VQLPQDVDLLANLVMTKRACCDWENLNSLSEKLMTKTQQQLVEGARVSLPPFSALTLWFTAEQQQAIAQNHAEFYFKQFPQRIMFNHTLKKQGNKKIKLAYISPNFRNHPTAQNVLALLQHHCRNQFELFIYALNEDDGSEIRQNIIATADHFIELTHLNYIDAAQKIYTDGIDVIISLMGYTDGSRVEILASHPVPVQIGFQSFPGTLGTDIYDYFIADKTVIPEKNTSFYNEKIINMPNAYYAIDPFKPQGVVITREACHLPKGAFVFGCFCSHYKVEPEVFNCWMQLLKAVPGAVLWLFGKLDHVKNNLRKTAEQAGIDSKRLIFAPGKNKAYHLARHQFMDLCLDTFICGAHTTAVDALKMGVPLITYPGETLVTRVSSALLQTLELPELITRSHEEYLSTAIFYATNQGTLKTLRAKLTNKLKTTPLFDISNYVYHIEYGIKSAWQRYQQGEAPQQIDIPQQLHQAQTVTGSTDKRNKAIHPIKPTTEKSPSYGKQKKLTGKWLARFQEATNWHQRGVWQSAKKSDEKVLAKYPNHAESLHLLAVLSAEHEDVNNALLLFTKAIKAEPANSGYYLNRAVLYKRLKNPPAAIADFEKAIQLNSKQWSAHLKLGELFLEQQQYKEAIEKFLKTIEINPQDKTAHHHLGNCYLALGFYEQASTAYQKVLALDSNCMEALSNLGVSYYYLKAFEQAINCYQKAVSIKPNYPEAYANWGLALTELNRFDEAKQKHHRAIELAPQKGEYHSNLGNLYKAQGSLTQALNAFNQALALEPSSTMIRFNLAITQLQLGSFKEGWTNYEARFHLVERQKSDYHFSQPLWRGEMLAGKTLFISIEQGLGDTIQMVRYLPMLNQFKGTVIMECQKELLSLVANQFPQIKLIPRWQPPNHFDYHLPIMSLPFIFNTTLETIPTPQSYLKASQQVALTTAATPLTTVIKSKGLNVGIVWAGGKHHKNDANRSIELKQFEPLFELSQINYYSLQVGERTSDRQDQSFANQLIDLAPYIKDFSDTADLLEQLDLLISVDTAVAHLGGALGKPTWILLPFVADFRWLQHRSDSPWYDSVRLFQQSEMGDWSAPINEIKKELLKGSFKKRQNWFRSLLPFYHKTASNKITT